MSTFKYEYLTHATRSYLDPLLLGNRKEPVSNRSSRQSREECSPRLRSGVAEERPPSLPHGQRRPTTSDPGGGRGKERCRHQGQHAKNIRRIR